MSKNSGLLRVLLHLGLLLPLLWLGYLVLSGGIGTDPAERIVKYLGFTGACVLWGSLSMTPLRLLTGSPVWITYRRALGLWAFFYFCLHLLAFLVIWAGLDIGIVVEELTKRPYMYVGLTAWILMIPLAITSTRASRRRLGRHWLQLHRLVYVTALLGLLHIIWIAKLDYLQPALFGGVLLVLLLCRKLPARK